MNAHGRHGNGASALGARGSADAAGGRFLTELRAGLRLPGRTNYAAVDLPLAKRVAGWLWATSAALALAGTTLVAPTAHVGTVGWALLAAGVALALGVATRLLRHADRVGDRELARIPYAGVALITVLVWLTGPDSPYRELYLPPLLYMCGVQPPRRSLPFVGVVVILAALPLVEDPSGRLVAETLIPLALWSMLALAAAVWGVNVRRGRLELGAREREAHAEARRDPLTGLPNRRALDEALAAPPDAERADAALAVIVLDVEHLKAINDVFGHPAGDACLRGVALALRTTLDPADRCFRWAGDEFIVLVRGPAASRAGVLAADLAAAVANGVSTPDGSPVKVRTGWALPSGDQTSDELIAAADAALVKLRLRRHGPRAA